MKVKCDLRSKFSNLSNWKENFLIEKKGEKQWTEKGQKEKVSYCYFQSTKEFPNSFPWEGQEFISKDRNNWTTSLLNYDYSKPYHGLHFQTFLES